VNECPIKYWYFTGIDYSRKRRKQISFCYG
jgi:hypothetical protein